MCFKFLKSSGFTEKLKPLGILVPIRKPEHGKTSHKHYILGLKFKKLDALTSKKTVFFVNRSLSFKLQTGSLHSSVLLSTFFTLNWNFNTIFFESQNALTFIIFVSCNICCKRYVNLLSKAFSDLGGLVNCLTEHRRDEKVFLAMGNARHHLLVHLTLTYIVITICINTLGILYCSICINPHSKDFSVLTALARKHDRQRGDTLILVVVIVKPHQVFTHRTPNNIMKPAIFNYSNSHAKLFPTDL